MNTVKTKILGDDLFRKNKQIFSFRDSNQFELEEFCCCFLPLNRNKIVNIFS